MIDSYNPLRYRISSWDQLVDCDSNYSRKLSIKVAKIGNNDVLSGTRISVVHCDFGILFACVVGSDGTLVNPDGHTIVEDLSNEDILKELSKYGYFIIYEPVKALSQSQLDYLRTLRGLNYDKIRVLAISDDLESETSFARVVAFRSSYDIQWLNGWYCASMKEFQDALVTGNAINVSAISQQYHYDWSWLYGWIGDIDDILEEHDSADDEGDGSE